MKIHIYDYNFHQKNRDFIVYFTNKYHTIVNFEEAEIIYSPFTYIDIHMYPSKKFIFGPHFSVFPNDVVRKFNNIHNNAIYIQPSHPSVNTWQNEFNFKNLPMTGIPFGVDTLKFSPNNTIEKNNVIIYYKQRDPREFQLLVNFLNNKQITFKVFDYLHRYKEEDFLNYLKTCKYCIWLGRHESQGFALQEILSCDVPILVWSVKLRKQEYPYRVEYQNVSSEVSTIPYWDSKCGEYFYEFNEFENKYNTFMNNLNNYKPRQFILDNLSMEKCSEKWNQLISNL
jgi:hypothetical protein